MNRRKPLLQPLDRARIDLARKRRNGCEVRRWPGRAHAFVGAAELTQQSAALRLEVLAVRFVGLDGLLRINDHPFESVDDVLGAANFRTKPVRNSVDVRDDPIPKRVRRPGKTLIGFYEPPMERAVLGDDLLEGAALREGDRHCDEPSPTSATLIKDRSSG